MFNKRTGVVLLVLSISILLLSLGFGCSKNNASHGDTQDKHQVQTADIYYCPMHPSYVQNHPGNCPICGMRLVKKEKIAGTLPETKGRTQDKILFYRNPMHAEVTSLVPMKDEMGMDYVPVYADQQAKAGSAGIYISPEKQRLIGVTTAVVEKRKLATLIRTVGKVAYDPALYVAQEEYVQAVKTVEAVADTTLASAREQAESLRSASGHKLALMGMSQEEIHDLDARKKADAALYLPGASDKVWVYATLYEYEMEAVKEGESVEIGSSAFPQDTFKGRVVSIKPVLTSATRTLEARVEVTDPEHKLRPEMFVDAVIHIDAGETIAVPDTAVMDTGLRKIVYLSNTNGMIEPREITTGQKAEGYYQVLQGLHEGDVVVTSGNFLVDSESKLRSSATDTEGNIGE